jgi:hypothetical protein
MACAIFSIPACSTIKRGSNAAKCQAAGRVIIDARHVYCEEAHRRSIGQELALWHEPGWTWESSKNNSQALAIENEPKMQR